MCFISLYAIVCDYTNTKIQECLDYEEMKQVVYKLYIEDYNELIKLIKQVITPSGRLKRLISIPSKETEKTKYDINRIPEIHFIPDEILRKIK